MKKFVLATMPFAFGFRTTLIGADDDPTKVLTVPSFKEFAVMDNPAVIPDLVPAAGNNITVEIQEHKQYMKAAEYTWYIAGNNGVPLAERIYLGKLKSKPMQRTVYFRGCVDGKNCKKDTGRENLFRLQYSLNANPFKIKPPKFYVQTVKGKQDYYTIVKEFMNYGRSHYGGQRRMALGVENYSVYMGKCKKPPCGQPVLTASGHFKGWNFNFYKPGQEAPIAFMDVKSAKWGMLGVKQTFIMTISEGIDSALLMSLVSIIDLVNNGEAER